ncbi:nucleoside triphosphate pyrophosphohydrolase family protein [Psychrobacter cibarius]|nr:nucleoside triphosphate pyrophosphohydrolase family protein [Psychrobacter cibarius]
MSNLPLKVLPWNAMHTEDKRIFVEHAQGAGVFYTVYGAVDSDFGTRWHDQMEGSHGKKEGFESIEEVKLWIETDHYPSKMQPYFKPDSITDITDWFKRAKPEPTDKDRLTQIGCHYEEVSEMMVACHGDEHLASKTVDNCARGYKNFLEEIAFSAQPHDHIELLDALCDQIVTATGVAYMMGFDIEGALKEVIRSNNSKMVKGKFEFDANGKIMKPDSYSKPDLTPFISTMQNLHKRGDCE